MKIFVFIRQGHYINYHWVSPWLFHSPAPSTALPVFHVPAVVTHSAHSPFVPCHPPFTAMGTSHQYALWVKALQKKWDIGCRLGVAREYSGHVCSLLEILLPLSGCGELKGEKVGIKGEDKEEELQDSISEFWFCYHSLLFLFLLLLLLLLLSKLYFYLALGETWKNRLNIPTFEFGTNKCFIWLLQKYIF